MTDNFGSEFAVLLKIESSEIAKISGERVAAAIDKVRTGEITVDPGYDGVFGKVNIWDSGKEKAEEKSKEQMSLF